jgi:hypothetical protein
MTNDVNITELTEWSLDNTHLLKFKISWNFFETYLW